jgi:hypothetical protein
MAITVVTANTNKKLVTLSQFKDMLGITGSTNDALINSIISRVSAFVETYCNRKFSKQTIKETLPMEGSRNIVLSRFPVISITAIKYDGTTVPVADYALNVPDAGLVFAKNGWNHTSGEYSYEVEYEYGYVLPSESATNYTLPDDIVQAVLQLCKSAYLTRQTHPNAKSEEVPDVHRTVFAGGDLAGTSLNQLMSEDVVMLLAPYRSIKT